MMESRILARLAQEGSDFPSLRGIEDPHTYCSHEIPGLDGSRHGGKDFKSIPSTKMVLSECRSALWTRAMEHIMSHSDGIIVGEINQNCALIAMQGQPNEN